MSCNRCSVVDNPAEFTYVEPAQSITFLDIDMDIGQIGGITTILRANDEYNVDFYCVYLGTADNDKALLLGEVPQTGSDMAFFVQPNNLIGNYTRLVVYTRNDENESNRSVETTIEDRQGDPPANYAQGVSFDDEDSDQWEISGTINIKRAIDEDDITAYVVYYVNNNSTFTKIIELTKTGDNVSYPIPDNTPLGDNKYLFVVTKNGIDVMPDGVPCVILDQCSDKVKLVTDIFPGPYDSNPSSLTVYNNKLYFSADNGDGADLYSHDGNKVTYIFNSSNSFSSSLTVYNNKLYFSAYDNSYGQELWSYDSTTTRITDLNTGSEHSSPQYLTVYNNKLYFSATDGIYGQELWSYDSTTTTTTRITDLNTGSEHSSPQYLTVYNNKLYFSAIDGIYGQELWSYDSTTTTTTRITDLNTGSEHSSPQYLTVFNNKLYFRATDGVYGYEVWCYDDL